MCFLCSEVWPCTTMSTCLHILLQSLVYTHAAVPVPGVVLVMQA